MRPEMERPGPRWRATRGDACCLTPFQGTKQSDDTEAAPTVQRHHVPPAFRPRRTPAHQGRPPGPLAALGAVTGPAGPACGVARITGRHWAAWWCAMTQRPVQAFLIETRDGDIALVTFKGRDAWALSQLIAAGERGCTAIDSPGPRWSSYVHKLRCAGIAVETRSEAHGGAFAGHHARYVLRSRVRVADHGDRVAS